VETRLSGPVRHLACLGGAATRCLLAFALACAALLAAAQVSAAAPAEFSWSPDPPVAKKTATFTAVEDPAIAAYEWDLDGDGTYNDASGREVKRTFQTARVYEVGLITIDVDTTVNEVRKSVTVIPGNPASENQPPAASFVFFPAGPVAGEPITFVSTSSDPDSVIPASGLAWDLNGDGAFDDAQGASTTTTFPAPGTYTVSLRITTNASAVATSVLNVGVPGAPGSSVGQKALSLLSPFPVVRIAGRVSRRGARIRRLTVNAPPGTAVKVRCRGRGCPFKRVLRTVSARAKAGRALPPSRVLRVRRLEGELLRPGATLSLFATRAGAVGKYTRFRILKAKPPRRTDKCLVPGSGAPVACPSR
jgi:plastocyanin